jgi:uncharacterized protein
MAYLPARPDLGQLRRQAKELLRAARNGDPDALARIRAVSPTVILASAQLAVARGYGFASWPRLRTEVERRDILNSRDLDRLAALLVREPDQATSQMEHWCDHRGGASPLAYVAMLRFDARRLGLAGPLPGTGAMAHALIDAGAPVDGEPGAPETPLMTAASYGDAEVAAVLIAHGADIEATAAPTSGGVPGGTALRHAAVFGMTEVVDVLVAAGARPHGLGDAAAIGDVTGWLAPDTPVRDRVGALTMAADHQRLAAIDQLLAAGTPIDGIDDHGRQPLWLAAANGRPASVAHLLEHHADPNLRDPEHGRTALDWCRRGMRGLTEHPAHDAVEALLRPVTATGL